MADNSAEYELRLKDLFSPKLNEIERKMDSFESHFQRMNNHMSIGMNALGTALGIGIERAFSKAVDVIKETSLEVVRLGTEMEKTRLSFEVMMGRGADFSNMMISKFQQFAKETPFSMNQVVGGARILTAYGFDPEQMISTMKKLSDISSGLNIRFNDMAYLYGHMKELPNIDRIRMKQMMVRGIPVEEELMQMKGVGKGGLWQLIHDRKIVFKDIEEAFKRMTSEGGRFFNLSERLSLTVAGRWERVKDTIEIIETRMGEQLNPELGKLVEYTQRFVDKFNDLDMTSIVANFRSVRESLKGIVNLSLEATNNQEGGGGIGFLDAMSRSWRTGNHLLQQAIDYARIQINTIKGIGNPNWSETFMKDTELRKQIQKRSDDYLWDETYIRIKNKLDAMGIHSTPNLGKKQFNLSNKKESGSSYDEEGNNIGEGAPGSSISSATRNITVNINKLIETVNFTKSYEQSESNLRDMLTKALISEVNNVNLAIP